MASLQVATDPVFLLREPSYYTLKYSGSSDSKNKTLANLAKRSFYAALPFIALYRPLGKIITCASDSIRTFSSLSDLTQKKDCRSLLNTIITISALAGTIFMHPLGLCISTFQDLGCDLYAVLELIHDGSYQKAIYSLLSMTSHLCYLGTMLTGSLEIIALSMLLNMAIEFCRSREEFQKGNLIEGTSHLLMSLVRFSQSLPHIEKIAHMHNIKGKNECTKLRDTMDKIRDTAAVFFYRCARFFISPMWISTKIGLDAISFNKNDENSTTQKVYSTTKAVLSLIILLPFSLIVGPTLGQVFHFSAYLLSSSPYIHIKTGAELKPTDKPLSFFQLNCCLPSGGFAQWFGGLTLPNKQRVLQIAEKIRESAPDIVCLQEVSDLNDAFSLYQELSKEYGEFYFNMGPTPLVFQNNSGLFVASKVSIDRPELHSFSGIEGIEGAVNKCFFLFSTEKANFITTHLSPSKNDLNPTAAKITTRAKEQERILLAASQRSSETSKPTYISGDFNINWGTPEYRESRLFKECVDQYNRQRLEVSDQEATAETEYLIQRNWHHEKDAKPQRLIIDYFISFSSPEERTPSIRTSKISTFDINDPKHALSDHAALLTDIT